MDIYYWNMTASDGMERRVQYEMEIGILWEDVELGPFLRAGRYVSNYLAYKVGLKSVHLNSR